MLKLLHRRKWSFNHPAILPISEYQVKIGYELIRSTPFITYHL